MALIKKREKAENAAMKQLFTDDWQFHKFPLGTDYSGAKRRQGEFGDVELPHDWLIEDTANLYENSSGWYRKCFDCKKQEGLCYILRFEGVYMDSELYVNGSKAAEWKYGYSTFEADLTPWLTDGENEIMLGAHYQTPNSRWYSGAGIYRNVWLLILPETHFASDGIYITTKETEEGYLVRVTAEAVGDFDGAAADAKPAGTDHSAADMPQDTLLFRCRIGELERESYFCRSAPIDRDREETPCHMTAGVSDGGVTLMTAELSFLLENARAWDIDDPFLYGMSCQLVRDGELLQQEELRFGCRTIRVDSEKGFFLNHRHRKLNGVCLHHDLGALGAAVKRDAVRRQLRIMKEMGANAVRTAHNMPSVELMELADEMGLFVVSESFDCWERPKTPYDYARFFKEWWKKDVASWVRRDRNHPSLVFWSIGNEIYDMHADGRGAYLTRRLMDEVYLHDPGKNAFVTFGSNYMPWENAQKCADIVKIAGYNYSEKYYDEHHREHPDWVIYGSETASTVQSRGIYHFPLRQPVLADVDEQCSALGNSTTSWGAKSSEACILAERDHQYSMGQFLWSGFDYIGEPTPYHTKNSYFGQADTAGFPKDSYYIYQAEWTDYRTCPMIHLFPYWDFNEGQTIDVRICSNAPVVELFVNGRSLGKTTIDHAHGSRLVADYRTPYEKGEITAVAYDGQGKEIARQSRHSFGEPFAVTVRISDADGRQTPFSESSAGTARGTTVMIPVHEKKMLFMEIGMRDRDGFPVENAGDRVIVKVSGEGRLLGLDNGDSTDYEQYKGDSRKLFSGKLLAMLETSGTEGGLQVCIDVPEEKGADGEGIGTAAKVADAAGYEKCAAKGADAVGREPARVRKIELLRQGTGLMNPEHRESEVLVRVHPAQAAGQKLQFDIVTDGGIRSELAEIEEQSGGAADRREQGIVAALRVRAKGDGDFWLRATADNGAPQVRVISSLDYHAEGLGTMYFNPYRLVAGGLYNDSIGEVTNGNEFGAATARDQRTVIGFRGVDFGEIGSDRVTLPVFELGSRETPIGIWLGKPGGGGRLIDTVLYHKPSVWNTYQEETYRLPERLRGVCDLYFELHQKIHLKGFVFERLPKAFEELCANQNQRVYGDSLTVTPDGIMDIGNNVTIEFDDMDFGEDGCGGIRIFGRTPNPSNTIHIRFSDGEKEIRQVVEFAHTAEAGEQVFAIDPVCGRQKVSFVFMPGSRFDFIRFRFEKKK